MATMQKKPDQVSDDPARAVAADALPLPAPRRRPVLRLITRITNPVVKRLAGRRHAGLFAVILHRGRRSGRIYATPVGAVRTTDGFVVPLTFGVQADWYRNLQAAGGCRIRWKGDEYTVVEPQLLDGAAARAALPGLLRTLAPVAGIRQVVRVRRSLTA